MGVHRCRCSLANGWRTTRRARVVALVGVITSVWIGAATTFPARRSLDGVETAYERLDQALAEAERRRDHLTATNEELPRANVQIRTLHVAFSDLLNLADERTDGRMRELIEDAGGTWRRCSRKSCEGSHLADRLSASPVASRRAPHGYGGRSPRAAALEGEGSGVVSSRRFVRWWQRTGRRGGGGRGWCARRVRRARFRDRVEAPLRPRLDAARPRPLAAPGKAEARRLRDAAGRPRDRRAAGRARV